MSVFTVRFVLNTGPGWVYYTVPGGKRAVVKCVNFVNSGPNPGAGALAVAGALLIYRTIPVSTGADIPNQTIAANAGETIGVYNGVAGIVGQASGFLFDI